MQEHVSQEIGRLEWFLLLQQEEKMKKYKKKKLWWNAGPDHPKETFRNELTKLETKKEVWWDVRYFTVLSLCVCSFSADEFAKIVRYVV